jgi:hypothetical protein
MVASGPQQDGPERNNGDLPRDGAPPCECGPSACSVWDWRVGGVIVACGDVRVPFHSESIGLLRPTEAPSETHLTGDRERIRQRCRRGLGPGHLPVGLAETLLAGGNLLVDLDYQRADVAGTLLRSLPPPPSTTAVSLARHFGRPHRRIQQAITGLVAMATQLLPDRQRRALTASRPRSTWTPPRSRCAARASRVWPIPWHFTAQLLTATRARPTRRRQRTCRIPCHLGEERSEGRAGRSWLPPSRPTTGPRDHRVQGSADGGREVGADAVGDRDERRLHHRGEAGGDHSAVGWRPG